MVRYYSGVDGLKTGYTKSAGYCITTTAMRDNMRLITVVMGEPSSSVRSNETAAMLDYGFNTYKLDNVINKDTILGKSNVILGKELEVDIVPMENVNILNNKVGLKRNVTYNVDIDNIKAPVRVGDVVGRISVMEDGKSIMNIGVTVKNNVDKANIFIVFIRDLMDIIRGNI